MLSSLNWINTYRQSLDEWRVSVAGAYWAANKSARSQLSEKTSGFNEAEIRLEIKWTFQGLNVINIHKSYLQKLAAKQTFHEKISFVWTTCLSTASWHLQLTT